MRAPFRARIRATARALRRPAQASSITVARLLPREGYEVRETVRIPDTSSAVALTPYAAAAAGSPMPLAGTVAVRLATLARSAGQQGAAKSQADAAVGTGDEDDGVFDLHEGFLEWGARSSRRLQTQMPQDCR